MSDRIDLQDLDRAILRALQQDCRLSNAQLAERVGLSPSACWRRVRMLEEAGVISGYAATVDPDRAGLEFHAIVHVRLARHDREAVQRVMTELTVRPEVVECFATTGQYDYHLRVLCADMTAYRHFLDDFLFRLPAIESAQTNVVLESIKRRSVVPV
ncbi:MAG TPA: Lrp/AsnC family transcriptional regulator [Paracoccus sp. (in: a-proteobacteria)]|uniref:Lrp/AsnC family transcriptional regulator n=1 Tax=uncultured Paracoccus sp. TaxID=189685 RepID=UPI0026372C57|nr:Lrp/AsnC family transcriptional regulator [uncultured Paracoccus sp.]HMQ41486.1 Lrp/AsnC family transcriptional regulator [Paracoccus sp. (in: a-proteobacteria)]HMR36071.1 Lrp/AsnC family transcriptional regulator [Paracoccus sp. (in: a-proteobacteria)]